MTRDVVEDILTSKLPCGHPDACSTSNATGSRIRCAWCDEANTLKEKLRLLEKGLEISGIKPHDYSRRPIIKDDPGANENLSVWWDKWSKEEKEKYWLSLLTPVTVGDSEYREPMYNFKCTRCGMTYTSFPPAECPLCHNVLDQAVA
jgi:hypothetical protein